MSLGDMNLDDLMNEMQEAVHIPRDYSEAEFMFHVLRIIKKQQEHIDKLLGPQKYDSMIITRAQQQHVGEFLNMAAHNLKKYADDTVVIEGLERLRDGFLKGELT